MSSRSPREFVFTLFGEYLLHRPTAVWVGSLIELLAPLGVSEGAARTALSRMGSRGWLTSERRGRNAFYSLTPEGRRLLREGEERIHRPSWDEPWDGTWRIVSYSIPESDRSLRDRLRRRLKWIGFGSPGNGLWVTPRDDAEDRVAEVVERLGISDHVELFEGRHLGFTDTDRLVERCWDLPGIHRTYVDFIDRHLPQLEGCRSDAREGDFDPEEAFVRRFLLVHEWRRFAEEDPHLPRELLPDDWAGECAAGLFRRLRELLEGPAESHVEGVLDAARERTDSTVSVGRGVP